MFKNTLIIFLGVLISAAAQANSELVCKGTAVFSMPELKASRPDLLTVKLNQKAGKIVLLFGPQKFEGSYNAASGEITINNANVSGTGSISPIDGNQQTYANMTITDKKSRGTLTIYAPLLRCQ